MFNWSMKVPSGYHTRYVTLREMESHLEDSGDGMPREAIRRHLSLMHSRNGALGLGGGWRRTPSNTSAASRAGRSLHQRQHFYYPADASIPDHAERHNGRPFYLGYVAIDYVWRDGPDPNDWHDGVPTGGVPVQGTAEANVYGIHANVGTPGKRGWESWHGQPVEYDGWARGTRSGSHPFKAMATWALPPQHDPYLAEVPDVLPPDPGWPPVDFENNVYGLWPLNDKPDIYEGYNPAPADVVRYFQAVATNQAKIDVGAIDGYSGTKTDAGIRSFQRWNGLEEDGRCGPNTWAVCDSYAAKA